MITTHTTYRVKCNGCFKALRELCMSLDKVKATAEAFDWKVTERPGKSDTIVEHWCPDCAKKFAVPVVHQVQVTK
jgi:hypothetical protein